MALPSKRALELARRMNCEEGLLVRTHGMVQDARRLLGALNEELLHIQQECGRQQATLGVLRKRHHLPAIYPKLG